MPSHDPGTAGRLTARAATAVRDSAGLHETCWRVRWPGILSASHRTLFRCSRRRAIVRRTIIACKTVEAELLPLVPEGVEIRSLDQGLHRHPDHLRETLQREIDSVDADEILLAYGLCGNGVVGLKSERARLVVPRVDDCIAMLLGSYDRYRQEVSTEPGTYWLSHGWIEHASDPYKEYRRVREKWDEETARWVAHETMKGYRRLTLIETTACPIDRLRPYAREFAEFFGLRYEETSGTLSLFQAFLSGDYDSERFAIAEPGRAFTSDMFLPSVGLPNG